MMRLLQWKWILRITVVTVLLTCVMPVSIILYIRNQGASELKRVKAKITAEDPNWELDDLAKELNAKLPPDDKNPFIVVEKAHALIPKTYDIQVNALPDATGRPAHTLMPDSELVLHDKIIVTCDPALKVARQVAGMTEGGRVLQMPRNPMTATMTPIQNQRTVAAMLRHDAINHAMHNRPDQAVNSCRCILGVSRAIGSEPSLLAQLVRMAIDAVAVSTIEQTLNLTEPKQGLAELQADLQHNAKFPYLKASMRGERAYINRIFEIVRTGEIQNTPGAMNGLGLSVNAITLVGIRLNLATDHAFALNMMNEFVAASQLPTEQQIAAIQNISRPPRQDVRYNLSSMLLPGLQKVTEASFRNQGKLAAATAAVACERYRQKFREWPVSLEAIPKDILPEVPTDPCSGKPIIYKRMTDHIIVYSVGQDRIDNGGQIDHVPGKGTGNDYGVRIYDPTLRRQPAPPPLSTELLDAPAAAKP